MLRKTIFCMLAMFISTALPRFVYGAEDGTRVWTIYVAVPPGYMYCRKSNGEYVDITKYKYPLYIGYIYMDESGLIKYRCLIPGAGKNIARWVDYKNSTAGKTVSTYGCPDWYRKANIGEKNYVEIAANDISRAQLVAIKVTPDKLPDDSWVPQFKHQYAIDFLNTKAINAKCAPYHYDNDVDHQLSLVIKSNDAFAITN